jgi:hypothetical protein
METQRHERTRATQDMTRDQAPVWHRVQGMGLLAVAGFLSYLFLVERVITPKLLFVTPLVAATGLWQLLCGHPLRADGMTPAWWRIGLVVTAVVFVWVTLDRVSP